MENPALIQPFLDYLAFEKRYSPHTLAAYRTDLTAFFDYIAIQYGSLPLSDLSHLYIRSWLASLKDEGLTARSINRKISTLKSFFKHALRHGLLQQSPMTRVTAPKNEKRLPSFVADGEMERLFTDVSFPEDWQGRTDRLLLLLFYHTGMRLSELTGLTEGGVNFANQTIKVLGKGGKERLIPIGTALASDLKAYLRDKDEAGVCRHFLLAVEAGRGLQSRQVYSRVKAYLSLVTTIEKRSPHVLRHSFATHLMNNGAELNAVKELLGHSSLAATQVYTHNTIEKLKNIHAKAHPKA